jgi:hypothetical protein
MPGMLDIVNILKIKKLKCSRKIFTKCAEKRRLYIKRLKISPSKFQQLLLIHVM